LFVHKTNQDFADVATLIVQQADEIEWLRTELAKKGDRRERMPTVTKDRVPEWLRKFATLPRGDWLTRVERQMLVDLADYVEELAASIDKPRDEVA
jgi:hypothetical protein